MLYNSQYGFRRGRSAELALLQQKELILNYLENKWLVLGILIDLSKAFDCLNHETLLKKLERYVIRGQALELLHMYLKHCQQTVVIEGHSSTQKHIKAGVLQGSILGPLLFIIYINDIVNTSKAAEFIIYADDTSIFVSGTNINAIIEESNAILGKLSAWAKNNYFKNNTEKTQAAVFRTKRTVIDVTKTLVFYTVPVDLVQNVRTVGFFITKICPGTPM